VNYYEHHIGDFLKRAAHLSALEEGIYRRLRDVYYTIEGPLPADVRECCRRARAVTKAERDAVSSVLDEFFELRDDGWHEDVVDEEIARYHSKQPEAEAKKENDRERQRRARERRKQLFEELRGHGIVAPWDATTEQLQDALSRATNTTGHDARNAPVTQPVTRDNTATHSPLPTTQQPESAARSSRAPAREPPEPTLAGQACRLMREAGTQRVNPSDPRLLQLLSQGVTPQQLGDLSAELREARGGPQNMALVVATMAGRLRDAAAMPQHPPGTAQRIGERRNGSAFGDEIDRISAAIDGRTKPAKPEPVTIDVEARRVG
jgi:uncharacterized protein YdaU (DUF1376 family)